MDRDFVLSVMASPPPLTTDRLILRKLGVNDTKDMFEYSSDPDVTRYLTWKPHPNIRHTNRYLKGIDAAYADSRCFDWAITIKNTGKMIGTCGYTSFDFELDSVEVGYVLNPRYEGYGLMTEALGCVLNYAFGHLKARRAEGRFMVGNEKSRAVMERCGMKFETVRNGALYHDGRYIDVGLCSVLAEDYLNREVAKS